MSRYKTAAALEMAVKAAARRSPMDTNAAIEGFYFHRLLVRIFDGGASPFVLKGGHGMLARTLDARRTRDIDIVTDELDISAALRELCALVSRDMDDFLSYEVAGYGPIKTGDRYRDGYSVSVSVAFGGRAMRPISIDLVSDEVECGRPEYLTPADRLDIAGLPVCDYPVYPVEAAMVDKLCGIVERHGGRPSSRVKDLVDLVVYAAREGVDGDELESRLRRETAARGMSLPDAFCLPAEWEGTHERLYGRLIGQTALGESFPSMADAARMAARLLDPALAGSCGGKRWDSGTASWRGKGTRMNKITCICLGVSDMRRSVAFYRDGLGFRACSAEDSPRVCFFDTPGTKLELYPLDLLAKDVRPDDPPAIGGGFGGMTLTYNVADRREVDNVIALVRAVGGTVVKEPQETSWGGYHAYFADPDGHYWEVAWGPDFKYDESGMLVL